MSKIEIEADVPDGWVGVEYRPPKKGEWYLRQGGTCLADFHYSQPWLILRCVEPKKESQFINLYPQAHPAYGAPRSTRESADKDKTAGRVGVVRIDYENGHPVSVALESVEGKG